MKEIIDLLWIRKDEWNRLDKHQRFQTGCQLALMAIQLAQTGFLIAILFL